MTVPHIVYLANSLVRTLERAIGWIVELTESLYSICGRKFAVRLLCEILDGVESLLLVGKRYLERVRKTLQYRLYFETVIQPMRKRYKQLKRSTPPPIE